MAQTSIVGGLVLSQDWIRTKTFDENEESSTDLEFVKKVRSPPSLLPLTTTVKIKREMEKKRENVENWKCRSNKCARFDNVNSRLSSIRVDGK